MKNPSHKMIDSSISSSFSLQSSGALSLSESYFHQIEQILYPDCLTARTRNKLYTSQSIELRRTCRKYIFPLFLANQNRTNPLHLLALTPTQCVRITDFVFEKYIFISHDWVFINSIMVMALWSSK